MRDKTSFFNVISASYFWDAPAESCSTHRWLLLGSKSEVMSLWTPRRNVWQCLHRSIS